jgi:hypothetical protein
MRSPPKTESEVLTLLVVSATRPVPSAAKMATGRQAYLPYWTLLEEDRQLLAKKSGAPGSASRCS